jgi:ubiquinone/menaquinone biosynthesis C-methylase UbiE
MTSTSWLAFWERPNRIFVNERHRAIHYARLAEDIRSVLPARPDAKMLDYGCGEALVGLEIAPQLGWLYLYDTSRPLRARLQARFATEANVTVLDDASFAALPAASLDLVVINSVLQYVPREDLPPLLRRLYRFLRPDGELVLADIIPPQRRLLSDALVLLRTAWRHGFLIAALLGLAVDFASDYRRVRQRAGFSTYDEKSMLRLLGAEGFEPRRRERNFGFNQGRMTFIARKPG